MRQLGGTTKIQESSGLTKEKESCSTGAESDECVWVDSSYILSWEVAFKLRKYYLDQGGASGFNCEVDCYGDFLQALGEGATDEYIADLSKSQSLESDSATEKTGDRPNNNTVRSLQDHRQGIFSALKGTPLQLLSLGPSVWAHTGTMPEYLDNCCGVFRALLPRTGKGALEMDQEEKCDIDHSTLGRSNLQSQSQQSSKNSERPVLISSLACHDSVIDASTVLSFTTIRRSGITVGKNSILSDIEIANTVSQDDVKDAQPIAVPPNSFLHTICGINSANEQEFITVACNVRDDMKASALSLRLFQRKVPFHRHESYCSLAHSSNMNNHSDCNFWNARLFAVFSDRSSSVSHALACLRDFNFVVENHASKPNDVEETWFDGYLQRCGANRRISLDEVMNGWADRKCMLKFRASVFAEANLEDIYADLFRITGSHSDVEQPCKYLLEKRLAQLVKEQEEMEHDPHVHSLQIIKTATMKLLKRVIVEVDKGHLHSLCSFKEFFSFFDTLYHSLLLLCRNW
mgnify:CR=1 FL=1